MTHGPITADHRALLNQIAVALDDWLNPGHSKDKPRNVGFALLTYRFGEPIEGTGRVNYIGNGQREDVRIALKELLARWEGRRIPTPGTH